MKRRKPKPMTSNGQNAKCQWCGIQCTNTSDEGPNGATRDHVQPKALGYAQERSRVWSCRACNNVKSDMTLLQWKAFMAAYPEWRSLYQAKGTPKLRADFVAAFKARQNEIIATRQALGNDRVAQ